MNNDHTNERNKRRYYNDKRTLDVNEKQKTINDKITVRRRKSLSLERKECEEKKSLAWFSGTRSGLMPEELLVGW